jgi:hypothetical protein
MSLPIANLLVDLQDTPAHAALLDDWVMATRRDISQARRTCSARAGHLVDLSEGYVSRHIVQ